MTIALFAGAIICLIAGGLGKNMLILWASAACWLIFSVLMYEQSTATWDWEYATMFIGFFFTFATALYAGSTWSNDRKEKVRVAAESKGVDLSDIIDDEDYEESRELARQQRIYDQRTSGGVRRRKKRTPLSLMGIKAIRKVQSKM